jgi:hypothetical protein
MGRSPCKIALMPFTFANNSIVIHRGLHSLFIFKSIFLFRYHAEALLRTASASRYPSYSFLCFFTLWFQLKTEGTCSCIILPETLLNHVFEDLRKPKAPNTPHLGTRKVEGCNTREECEGMAPARGIDPLL